MKSIAFSDLERVAQAHFAAAALPGAVLHVVTADGPQLTVEHGDLTAGTPVMLGSTSKAVTAALLLQQVDEGLVDLDDPVLRYLPEVDLPEEVTLGDLACHVSGLRTDANPRHLIRQRDRRFTYANQNYNLLGEVLSATSGVPFGRLLSDRLGRMSSEGIIRPLESTSVPGRGSKGHLEVSLPRPRMQAGSCR